MINFKYFNEDKVKRLGSAILLTTILGTTSISLSGCDNTNKNENNSENIVVEDNRKNYGVFIENDIATIYTITRYYDGAGYTIYYSDNKNQTVFLGDSLIHFLKNYTIEEAEDYARILLTENGIIRYYNVEGKENPKTLTKTK